MRNLKSLHLIIPVACVLSSSTISAQFNKENSEVLFRENKGQVYDQNYNIRHDVLFSGTEKGMVFHLKNNGISYQLSRVDKWMKNEDNEAVKGSKIPEVKSIYRIDINWLNTNQNFTIEKGESFPGASNYYLPSCPNGALNVKSYNSITYKNIYNKIDLKWYNKGSLEYDFIVQPGGDYKQIQIEINGAKKIIINSLGELEIETPFGKILEKAPVAYQNKKLVSAHWALKSNKLSFKIDSYNPSEELIIDPVVRVWGTYYGGTGNDNMMDTKTDLIGNVYIAGFENGSTNLATVGSHQAVISGFNDCVLAKFNSIGVRQWATYYGGTGNDYAYGCAVAPSGDVYIGGSAASTSSISTVASHQAAIGGGTMDGFLAKFNSSGVRQWATYYGGSGDEFIFGCSSDPFGNIFVSGRTTSTNNISSPGSFQTTFAGGATDAFMAKFSPGGVRRWGTYYGSTGIDEAFRSITDATGKVFFTGFTDGTGTVVATPGTHQPLSGGGGNPDGLLVKFDSVGVRQWATLYGGAGSDYGRSCAIDAAGDIYLCGYAATSGGTTIATPGSHQPTYAGGSRDGYLVKFNSVGVRQWGTYVGGAGADDFIMSCQFDGSSNIYVAGYTTLVSTAILQLSTAGSHQTTTAGLNDGFLNKFNLSGVRQWGTYYGGALDDYIQSSCLSSSGAIYVVGGTSSSTGISTSGSQQAILGSATDGFLAQFKDCAGTTFSVSGATPICPGQPNTLTASGTGITSYSWNTGPTTSSVLVTPSVTTVYTVSAGTGTAGCNYTTTVNVPVYPNPTVVVSASSSSICSGNSAVITATGAASYTWNPTGSFSPTLTVSPSSTTIYTVSGTQGPCSVSETITINVTTSPTINLSSSAPVICSGNSTLMNVYGATTYSWSSGPTTQSISLSPSATTNYTVSGYNGLCVDSKTFQLTVNPNPTISVSNQTICIGGTATLTASGLTAYNWSNGATTFSTTVNPTVTTMYTISGTNSFGCNASAPVNVVVSTSLGINVSASSTVICSGDLISISVNGATTYTWNTGANSASINVNPTVSSTYTVDGESGSCAGSNTIAITVNPLPTITASASSTLVCTGNTIALNANGANTYTWMPGNFTSGSITESPSVTMVYTVSGTNSNGCIGIQTVTANVSPCAGIKTFNGLNSEINIYPNPANDLVNIETSFDKFEITMYNAIGQLVFEKNNDSDRLALNLNSFAKGVYTIKLSSLEGIVIKKVIVE